MSDGAHHSGGHGPVGGIPHGQGLASPGPTPAAQQVVIDASDTHILPGGHPVMTVAATWDREGAIPLEIGAKATKRKLDSIQTSQNG